jgi:hypothetical protein
LNLIFFINICGDKYPWHGNQLSNQLILKSEQT